MALEHFLSIITRRHETLSLALRDTVASQAIGMDTKMMAALVGGIGGFFLLFVGGMFYFVASYYRPYWQFWRGRRNGLEGYIDSDSVRAGVPGPFSSGSSLERGSKHEKVITLISDDDRSNISTMASVGYHGQQEIPLLRRKGDLRLLTHSEQRNEHQHSAWSRPSMNEKWPSLPAPSQPYQALQWSAHPQLSVSRPSLQRLLSERQSEVIISHYSIVEAVAVPLQSAPVRMTGGDSRRPLASRISHELPPTPVHLRGVAI